MSFNENPRPFTRREALSKVGGGFGLLAFANLIQSSLKASDTPEGTPGTLKQLHFKPRAKRVIFLFSNGGMSHVDTFDPKPMLDKYNGQPMPGVAGRLRRRVKQARDHLRLWGVKRADPGAATSS